MAGTEALVVLLLCGLILLLIVLSSWYRRRKLSKSQDEPSSFSHIDETVIDGQRAFRIATVSRQGVGQLALEVYEIRFPRPNDSTALPTIRLLPPPLPPRGRNSNNPPSSPPPPFNTAINMPSPSSSTAENSNTSEESLDSGAPPPTYDEITAISMISGSKIPPSDCIVTVDQTTSTIINS